MMPGMATVSMPIMAVIIMTMMMITTIQAG